MSVRGLRFIHTSDWHLERPLSGLADVPDHLREALLDAPFRAATRVVDLAISENVDFLLLAGDIVQPALAGPRAVLFLTEQFERLAARKITVYWAQGPAEMTDDWLSHVHWPANVQLFVHSQVEQIDHARDGRAVARVVGRGYSPHHEFHPADFHPEPSDLPTVAVAYAGAEGSFGRQPQPQAWISAPGATPHALPSIALAGNEHGANGLQTHAPSLPQVTTDALRSSIDYWALGGRHRGDFTANVTSNGAANVHFSGTQQGRDHDEIGTHGCLLSSLSDAGSIRTQFLPTDELRWHDERVDAAALHSGDELEALIRQRLDALRLDARGSTLLARLIVVGNAPLSQAARRSDLTLRLIDQFRLQFGHAAPVVWTSAIDFETPLPSADAHERDDLLGDFLRLVARCEKGEEPPLDLNRYLPDRHRPGGMHDLLAIDDPLLRKRVLHEAALLGTELLAGHSSGEEAGV